MRIGASLAMIAIGAILKFAVTAQVNGLSLGVIGVILMIVGAVGLAISLALLASRRRTDVVYGGSRVSYVEPVTPVRDRYYV